MASCRRKEKDLIFSLEDLSVPAENSPLQRRFLRLVKDGDPVKVEETLKGHLQNFSSNIDCVDTCGRTAVELATIRGNKETVEMLLNHGADVGDALLYAVDTEKEDIVSTLLDYGWSESNGGSTRKCTTKKSLFAPHVTPVLLAAHRNNYNILKALLEHQYPLPSIGNINGLTDHTVMFDYYRAATSPAYILLTSRDPFEIAFGLTGDINNIVSCLETGQRKFQELSVQLEQFTAELIGFARCPDEVMTVLNVGDNVEDTRGVRMRLLQKAIAVGHKKFVVQDKCQELLSLLFFRHHHDVLYSPPWKKFLAMCLLTVLTPVLATLYMVVPKTGLGESIASPFIKFSMKSWSWFLFLTLMMLLNGDLESYGAYTAIGTYYVWVLGMVWEEIKEIWTGSVDALNKWDLLLLLCHVTAVGCFTGGLIAIQADIQKLFSSDEMNPFFVGSYLLAVAVILSFGRYMSMLTVSETFGPLLLSMYKMVVDIVRFIVVFLIVIVGFACALQRLYITARPDSECLLKYYQALQDRRADNITVDFSRQDFCYYGIFAHLHLSIFYLFMTLYGKFDLADLAVTSPKAVQFPVVSTWLRGILFVAYVTVSIIILLNMLIAMMSDSFASVSSDAEVEWRFARSREMLKYIPTGRTLPPPFNLIPTPKSVCSVLRWFILHCRGHHTREKYEMEFKQAQQEYKVTVERLTARYLLAYSLHRDQAEQ